MGYLPAFPSQMGIKGRLWQTNVFQDGSHETHLVFKVVGFKGMFELRRFSHLRSPLLIWERVEALPTPTPYRAHLHLSTPAELLSTHPLLLGCLPFRADSCLYPVHRGAP